MSLFKTLSILKNHGFNPQNILDIGACRGNWSDEVRCIFNDANFLLIEAIDYDELKNKCKYYPKYNYINALLFDKITDIEWYEERNTGDSIFKENTNHFKNTKPIIRKTTTLNELLKGNNTVFDLIKIDCQGAEIPILKGGSDIVSNTSFIILELPFVGEYNKNIPNFLSHIKFMDDIGFIPYDIVEFHYINNFLIQIDIMFINKNNNLNFEIQKMINNLGS